MAIRDATIAVKRTVVMGANAHGVACNDQVIRGATVYIADLVPHHVPYVEPVHERRGR